MSFGNNDSLIVSGVFRGFVLDQSICFWCDFSALSWSHCFDFKYLVLFLHLFLNVLGKQHSSEFSRLIAQVRGRMETSRKAQIKQEDGQSVEASCSGGNNFIISIWDRLSLQNKVNWRLFNSSRWTQVNKQFSGPKSALALMMTMFVCLLEMVICCLHGLWTSFRFSQSTQHFMSNCLKISEPTY